VDPRRLQDLPMLSKSPSTPPLPDCCLVQYCGQSRSAPDCERQEALPRTRRVYVEEPPSKTASRTAPVPHLSSSSRHCEITQHSQLHLPSLARLHIHDHLVMVPLHLRPTCITYLPAHPLPLSTANSCLDACLADAPIFTARTKTRRGKSKARCPTPGEYYSSQAHSRCICQVRG
jgi:hypothetical protein